MVRRARSRLPATKLHQFDNQFSLLRFDPSARKPCMMQLTTTLFYPTCLLPHSIFECQLFLRTYKSSLPRFISSKSPSLFFISSSTMAPGIHERPTAKTVCVMDASSRLGAALVGRLLHCGYTVNAAAFSRGDEVNASWSECKQVRAFRSDPLDYHSIADAVRGCSGVFYTFDHDSSYDEVMVEVEVRAAHNVLEACAQTETVERVVFTSSVTAVIWKENRKMDEDADERDWSEPNFCRKFKLWHARAKTLSEKTAWALAMDRGVNMVAVNAGLLLAGTELSSSNPYLKGAPEMYEDGVLVTVKLKFLVDAHICIFESPDAYGRYLCFNHTICCPEDAIKLAQMLSPAAKQPPPSDGLRVIQERISCKKLNKLMLEFGVRLPVSE